MIGKLIPAGTGFEPGQFSDETPVSEPSEEMLEGRVLDLFEEELDEVDFIDEEELEDVDEEDVLVAELDEDAEDEEIDDLDEAELEIVE
jgi:DNA-directed RNA polymerase subunit beta'